MEKCCEFCKALRPIVYCKADAAYLCLSCDSKVHSANALSFRHPRTLVCESCNSLPAVVRCFAHRMFMCHSCDDIIHRRHRDDDVVGFPHQKKVIGCYMGCPSARDLASLWGFDFNELQNNSIIDREGGFSSRGTKVVEDDERDQHRYSILQQILYLERLQLSEEIDGPHSLHIKEHKTLNSNNNNNNYNNNPMDNFDGNLEFQQKEYSLEEKTDDKPLSSSSSFSQLDHLASNNGNHHLHGDNSFWQYKSPSHNNEVIWLQNMQDLGVCDEVQCFDNDDVNIPDIDLTFRNFEELFRNEHDPISFKLDQDPSFGFGTTIEHYNDYNQLQTMINNPSYYSAYQYQDGTSYDSKKSSFHGNENVIMRNKEKKALRHEKQAYYTSPKSKSEMKKRGKGEVY
ncbi:hypothetical protein ACP275_05G038300 [Erythranthe tilingii]